jgi:hypothetical protein
MLRSVALVRTDVSEECVASIIRMTEIGDISTTLAAISSGSYRPDDGGAMFLRNSVLARATRRNIKGDAILKVLLIFVWYIRQWNIPSSSLNFAIINFQYIQCYVVGRASLNENKTKADV